MSLCCVVFSCVCCLVLSLRSLVTVPNIYDPYHLLSFCFVYHTVLYRICERRQIYEYTLSEGNVEFSVECEMSSESSLFESVNMTDRRQDVMYIKYLTHSMYGIACEIHGESGSYFCGIVPYRHKVSKR